MKSTRTYQRPWNSERNIRRIPQCGLKGEPFETQCLTSWKIVRTRNQWTRYSELPIQRNSSTDISNLNTRPSYLGKYDQENPHWGILWMLPFEVPRSLISFRGLSWVWHRCLPCDCSLSLCILNTHMNTHNKSTMIPRDSRYTSVVVNVWEYYTPSNLLEVSSPHILLDPVQLFEGHYSL